jgi:hypothetical protein
MLHTSFSRRWHPSCLANIQIDPAGTPPPREALFNFSAPPNSPHIASYQSGRSNRLGQFQPVILPDPNAYFCPTLTGGSNGARRRYAAPER